MAAVGSNLYTAVVATLAVPVHAIALARYPTPQTARFRNTTAGLCRTAGEAQTPDSAHNQPSVALGAGNRQR